MTVLDIKLKNGKPVFSWCPIIEESATTQIRQMADLPFVEHISIMPDCHMGSSVPIGSVMATNSVIVPVAVGVDIGCGMASFRTNLTLNDVSGKEEILHHAIGRSIPMGFSHNTDQRRKEMEQKYGEKIDYYYHKFLGANDKNPVAQMSSFFEQMGTLGGGNHFLEMQHDESGNIWVMVHSGSRNIGKRVCDHFNKIAQTLNEMWHSNSSIPFLPATCNEGKEYIGWMNMCLIFAYYNRMAMLKEIERNMLHYFPNMINTTKDISGDEIVNIHHNYASLENHFGGNFWVHRKGATLASDKTIGIIPGSQGTASYIVRGLGNNDSLNSCSHGAGRRMGRNAFNQAYNTPEKMREIEESLTGITHTKFGRAISRKGKDLGMMDLSESPQAYKDISSVMENQKDLVTPLFKLRPLINWKDAGEE